MKIGIYFISGFLTCLLANAFYLYFQGRNLDKHDSESIRFLGNSPLAIRQVEQNGLENFTPSGLQPEVIEQTITRMVAQNQNPDSSLQLVVDGYTKGLLPHWSGKTNHTDSTYRLLQWAEQIKTYSPENKDFKLVFDAIGGFWLEHIAKKLGTMAISNPELKYSYSFRYQADRCAYHHFLVNVPMTRFEKGLNQILESRIGYIANRITMDFSFLQLGLLTLAIAISLAGWILVLKICFGQLKKVSQTHSRKNIP